MGSFEVVQLRPNRSVLSVLHGLSLKQGNAPITGSARTAPATTVAHAALRRQPGTQRQPRRRRIAPHRQRFATSRGLCAIARPVIRITSSTWRQGLYARVHTVLPDNDYGSVIYLGPAYFVPPEEGHMQFGVLRYNQAASVSPFSG